MNFPTLIGVLAGAVTILTGVVGLIRWFPLRISSPPGGSRSRSTSTGSKPQQKDIIYDITAIFPNKKQADSSLEKLRKEGFADDEIYQFGRASAPGVSLYLFGSDHMLYDANSLIGRKAKAQAIFMNYGGRIDRSPHFVK